MSRGEARTAASCERENNSGTKAALIAGRQRRNGRRGVAQAVHYFKNFRPPSLSPQLTPLPPPVFLLTYFVVLPLCSPSLCHSIAFNLSWEERGSQAANGEGGGELPPSMQFEMGEREGRRGSFSPQLRVSSLSASDRRPAALQMFRAGREGGGSDDDGRHPSQLRPRRDCAMRGGREGGAAKSPRSGKRRRRRRTK